MRNESSSHQLKLFVLITVIMLIGVVGFYSPTGGAAVGQDEWKAPAKAKEMKNPVAADAKSLQKGKQLYDANCATCHGPNGAGDGLLAASLNPKPAPISKKTIGDLPDGELFWKISTGKLPMPAFEKTQSKINIWHIVNYIRTF
jgi:mono/diheme cytochrome c family protein